MAFRSVLGKLGSKSCIDPNTRSMAIMVGVSESPAINYYRDYFSISKPHSGFGYSSRHPIDFGHHQNKALLPRSSSIPQPKKQVILCTICTRTYMYSFLVLICTSLHPLSLSLNRLIQNLADQVLLVGFVITGLHHLLVLPWKSSTRTRFKLIKTFSSFYSRLLALSHSMLHEKQNVFLWNHAPKKLSNGYAHMYV